MGSFSIWHWLIILVFIGGIGFVIWKAASVARASKDVSLEGFGGWLLLLAIGQVAGLLRSAITLVGEFKEYEQVLHLPQGPLLVFGVAIFNLPLFGVIAYTTIVMLSRKRVFHDWFTAQWILSVIFPIGSLVWIWIVLGNVNEIVTPEFLGYSTAILIGGGIWVRYVHVSRRVANTFVN